MTTLDLFDQAGDEPQATQVSAPLHVAPEEALALVDWDFPKRIAHSGIEGLHPYPAKFIAELPRSLLEILPLPSGHAVFDPFCGSGTTLVEAQAKGYASIGVDLNPIACLMSRVKTSPLPGGVYPSARHAVEKARSISDPHIPDIPNVDHWFQPHIRDTLAALTGAIASAPLAHRDCLRLALSSIIVRVSNQESDTRYAAIAKSVAVEDVFEMFLRSAKRVNDVLTARTYLPVDAQVHEADTLTIPQSTFDKPVGMVITSPPYPNAYEYWLYHKYRMWWLNFDPIAVKEKEIGARAHFFRRNHHTADDFVRQMAGTFDLINAVLCVGGYTCFVIGRSRIHGQVVDNAKIIQDVAKSAGFSTVFQVERVLSANRKSFNLSHANIKTETIIVLRREGKV